jgi:hypothetical protein
MRFARLTIVTVAALAASLAMPAWAQGRHDDKPHGMAPATTSAPFKAPEGSIALKDGGALVIGKDGVTYHLDKAGKRVRMRDGQVMEAADGTKYMMKNDAVWRSITEKGTLHPSHQ